MSGFSHQALLYASPGEFVGAAGPYVREGAEAGDSVIAVTTRATFVHSAKSWAISPRSSSSTAPRTGTAAAPGGRSALQALAIPRPRGSTAARARRADVAGPLRCGAGANGSATRRSPTSRSARRAPRWSARTTPRSCPTPSSSTSTAPIRRSCTAITSRRAGPSRIPRASPPGSTGRRWSHGTARRFEAELEELRDLRMLLGAEAARAGLDTEHTEDLPLPSMRWPRTP